MGQPAPLARFDSPTCDPKKNGTASLKYHLTACTQNPKNMDKSQTQLLLPSKGQEGEISNISTWKFDQESIRRALGLMVVIDELPFRFVEGEGLQHFVSVACPRFHIPSRSTVTRDIYGHYINERGKLRQLLKNSCQRVCLTTDTWTSLQRINYMCLTAHFIDEDWKLHKKILNFCEVSSHKGDAIAKLIEKCLLSWGIDKFFTITVDNASSNDVAVLTLQKKFGNRPGVILNGKYMHMRCVAHIVNLIVTEGLKDLNPSVQRVRAAVRYVRQSPSRLQKFKECVEVEGIESKSLLCLDVSTRWNSTYLMLSTAHKFEKAFEMFEVQDENFRSSLESSDGFPTKLDWKIVKELVKFLEHFYELTLRVSGTSYVTSNLLFDEICEMNSLLQESLATEELDFSLMAMKMKDKFDKYWGDMEKLNILIFVAVILDPRHKLKYVEFAPKVMFQGVKGEEMGKKVKTALYELYNAYKPPNDSSSCSTQTSDNGDMQNKLKNRMQEKYAMHKLQSGGSGDNQSELDKYLVESCETVSESFDILLWWKVNSLRFPYLSMLARDVLAIPISTVASESTFSTGGRVLDCFRSSLTPTMAEALICYQDWIRNSSVKINLLEELMDVETVDNDSSWSAVVEPIL